MCTLSWQVHPDRLEILFSRDELLTRSPAHPPAVEWIDGTRVLAPGDPHGGGTWLASNEHGLTVCLLNRYPDRSVPGRWTSRGLLVRAMSRLNGPAQVGRYLPETPLFDYRPFTLVAFSPTRVVAQWVWDGRQLLEIRQPASPVSTSSLYPRLIPMLRRRLFRRATRDGSRCLTPEQQMALHCGRRPWPPAFAVAMLRRDRGTVSLTRVRATPTAVAMDYWQGDPARNPSPAPSQTLAVRECDNGRAPDSLSADPTRRELHRATARAD